MSTIILIGGGGSSDHSILYKVGSYTQSLSSNTTINTVFYQTELNNNSYLTKNSTSQITVAKDFYASIIMSITHGNNLNGNVNNGSIAINGTDVISVAGATAVGYYNVELKAGDVITGSFQRTDNNQHSRVQVIIFEIQE